MRLCLLLILFTLVAACDGAEPSQQMAAQETPSQSTSELGWFSGCWMTEDGKTKEVWSQDQGGLLFGYAFNTLGSGPVNFTFLAS